MATKLRYACGDGNPVSASSDASVGTETADDMTVSTQASVAAPSWGTAGAKMYKMRSAAVKSGGPEIDAALLRRIGAGERAAAQILLDQYLGRIVNYGYRMLGDSAEAEDVAQETFLRLWRNIETWRADAPLIFWLQRVAYNLCIDRLRRRRPASLDSAPEPHDPAASPVDRLHRAELSAAVSAAIARLPERQRAAIVFVHQEGLNNIETAALMGISVEAVESLLSRGRRALRATLEVLRPELKGDI